MVAVSWDALRVVKIRIKVFMFPTLFSWRASINSMCCSMVVFSGRLPRARAKRIFTHVITQGENIFVYSSSTCTLPRLQKPWSDSSTQLNVHDVYGRACIGCHVLVAR